MLFIKLNFEFLSMCLMDIENNLQKASSMPPSHNKIGLFMIFNIFALMSLIFMLSLLIKYLLKC